MEWTKCSTCNDHTSIGSYLFLIKTKSFPKDPDERLCALCGKATVEIFASYEDLLDAMTRPGK